ncbi:MAG: nucleoside recognition domain-containing protein [Bacillota bacterium]
MLNYIWAAMILSGFVIGALNGRLEAVTKAAVSSAGSAVELCIGLLGVMCLWSGLMKIMEKSGLVDVIAKLARPALKPLFPQIKNNGRALGAIVLNLSANFLGLGNAATPLGIKAMIELQKTNGGRDTASDAMCMFLVLNTSAIQLIPSTIIALRNDAGSAAPAEITACVWFASLCATLTGVIMAKAMSGMNKAGRRMYGRRKESLAA